MISAHAKESFDRIFRQAARTRLVTVPGGVCEIRPLSDLAPGEAGLADTHRVAVLTISSLSFRLLIALHFGDDPATRGYFAGTGEARQHADAFMEVANLCSGAINQALVDYFPDLGMSTPYVLTNGSVAHWRELRAQHTAFYALAIDTTVKLAATLCVCANAPIDFVAHGTPVEGTSGELELF